MNELKATPGQWQRNGDYVFALDDTQTVNRMSLLVSAGYVNWDTKRPALEDESVANAALIAAALELYTALDEMATFIRDYKAAMKDELPYPVLDRAEAALKKARGE